MDQEDEEFEIKIKEFLTIFKNDEISDRVITMINQEVEQRKKYLKKKKKQSEPLTFDEPVEEQSDYFN